jgi:regulator of protease activity HflC (stomatin/prohibitin superfamily)
MKQLLRTIFLSLLSGYFLFSLSACQTLESTEYGVRFWTLPPAVGGGVSSRVYRPGETFLLIPGISEFYTYDSSLRSIRWGQSDADGGGAHTSIGSYLQTRASDGNEVALAMTVSYRFLPDPEKLPELVSRVGTSDAAVEEFVLAAARSDIRSFMNEIRTSEFISDEARYLAVDVVKKQLSERLAPFGIEVIRVNLDDFKFWREKPNGELDTSYEDILKLIQQRQEDIRREEARYETVRQEKERQLTSAKAEAARLREEAIGYKNQVSQRGEGYLQTKLNQAQAVRNTGEKQAQGIREAVNALEGSGGRALLRLRLAEELLRNSPRFVLVPGGDGNKIAVERSDINQLLEQVGLLEALSKKSSASPPPVVTSETESITRE